MPGGAGAIYDSFNFQVPTPGLHSLTAELARPGLFVCPSDAATGPINPGHPNAYQPSPDPPGGTWPVALTSYAWMFGTVGMNWELRPDPTADPLGQMNDCFNMRPRITLADLTDGLGQTAFASERAMGYINRDLNGSLGRWASSFTTETLIYAMQPPNAVFRLSTRDPGLGAMFQAASSFHPGGVNVLMGDGSARLVKETVDGWPIDPGRMLPVGVTTFADGFGNLPPPGTWQKLTTRSGGEPFDDL